MAAKNVNTSNAHTKCVGTVCFNFMFYVYFMVCPRTVHIKRILKKGDFDRFDSE